MVEGLAVVCKGWQLLLLFSTSSSLNVLFCEYTDDSSGNLVMYDRFAVFANDVDTKFLEKEAF
jgi:hypothetical protein